MPLAPARTQLKPANVQTLPIKNWEKGVVTAFDTPRTPTGGLFSSGNCILQQDGTVRPRPSLVLYGTQPTGTVLGEIYEFRNSSAIPILNYRICMQVVSGTAQIYTSKDLGAWTAISGKTYSTTAKAHFCQINNKVLVMNGSDNLSYYDIPTAIVIPFTALTVPTAPTLTTNTGLTGTTFTITYRIAANSSVGKTIASTTLSVTVSTDRDLWTPTTQSLTIGWTAVTGAKSYNVYMGTGGVGTEFLIAGGISGTSYTDNGTAYQDTTQSYPLVDSTAGPKATRGDVLNNQVYLTGIADDPFSVIQGGTYPNNLDFSPANGGNTIPVGQGGKELPVRVRLTTGTNGSSSMKVYCSGTNGKARRYTLTPDNITVGNQSVNIVDVTEDDGEDGTNSPDAMLYYNNASYYPSADGFKTDGVLPQLQTFISTRRVSNSIQPDIATLNTEAMSNAVAMQYEGGRHLYAVPSGSTTNNQIWAVDLDRGGAWMKPWNIAADWMMQYNSNTIANGGDGQTHYTILSGNQVYELSYSRNTNDNGTAFSTNGNSGQLFFSPDQRVCAKLLNVIFTFLRPSGQINVNVAGQFRDQAISASSTQTFNPQTTIAGWSEFSWSTHSWSQIDAIPVANNLSSVDIKVKVNKEVRWFEYSWDSETINTDYQLSNVTAEFVITGIRDL